jgi:hypothetical protein
MSSEDHSDHLVSVFIAEDYNSPYVPNQIFWSRSLTGTLDKSTTFLPKFVRQRKGFQVPPNGFHCPIRGWSTRQDECRIMDVI